jgi:hypothetical protein
VARALADALESRSIPYAIGGAIAYGFHAPPRATNDVDLKVFLEPDALGPALEALGAAGAVLDAAASMRAAGERGDSSVAVRGMRVDVFVPSIPLYESARDRVQTVSLLGRPIRVLSAEDLVVFKMLFFRGKDLGDIERLLAFRGQDLDRAYVRRWLVELVGADDARVERWDSLARNSP